MPAQLAHWLILLAGITAAVIVAPPPDDHQKAPVEIRRAPYANGDDASAFTPPTADELEDFDARARLFIA